MTKEEFAEIKKAVDLAVSHIIRKGCDDIFKPPIFSSSLEKEIIVSHSDQFRQKASKEAISFIKQADLTRNRVGSFCSTLVVKDHQSFRQVAWIDPFDSVKYLAVCILLFKNIELARVAKEDGCVHSHRASEKPDELFDENYGYDSFRAKSAQLTKAYIGKWKVITDISNFFDRIGNHSLENHLLDVGCNGRYVSLLREMLLFWAGDRRSFGVPVGSDASRIVSEAIFIDIDRKLRERGIEFVRYVDDYRLFAETRAEAYAAVQVLTMLLADEGLSLNSKKTRISKIERDDCSMDKGSFSPHLEHEAIDLEEKVEVRIRTNVSGKSSYSKYYKEPGRDALNKIKELSKEQLVKQLEEASAADEEDCLKLVMKFFVYVDQDLALLQKLIEKKLTSIFYICDALLKEKEKLPSRVKSQIPMFLGHVVEWEKCAYPYQLPLLRLFSDIDYLDSKLSRFIVDNHKYLDNSLFFREVISLSFKSLDRSRMRQLCLSVYHAAPVFVQRAIFFALVKHPSLSADEKRPLIKNMRQHSDDWFIARIDCAQPEVVEEAIAVTA